MAGLKDKFLKQSMKKRISLLLVIGFFAVALILCVSSGLAYYHKQGASRAFASLIGNFDFGKGDITIMIYKENNDGTFSRTYYMPSYEYIFNDSLTDCTVSGCVLNDSTEDCYYTVNLSAKKITLTSDERVICKFYFEQEHASDVNVYVMKEDSAGTYTFGNKHYTLVNGVPAFGYSFNDYTCENPVPAQPTTLTYNSTTRKFTVTAKTKNNCYAYFDDTNTADIVANVFVQAYRDATVFNPVDSIPLDKEYKLSVTRTSACDNGGTISYTNNQIVINASSKQTCNIYLDIK